MAILDIVQPFLLLKNVGLNKKTLRLKRLGVVAVDQIKFKKKKRNMPVESSYTPRCQSLVILVRKFNNGTQLFRFLTTIP